MGGGGGEVNIVESCTCAYHNLELRSSVQNTCGNLVGADYHCLDISYGSHEIILSGIFLKEDNLIASLLED